VLSELNLSGLSVNQSRITRFANDLASVSENLFAISHDHFHLVGQDNQRRYLPLKQLRVRFLGDESLDEIAITLLAALGTQSLTTFSFAKSTPACDLMRAFFERWLAVVERPLTCEWLEESDESLAAAIADGQVDRLRTLVPKDKLPAIVHHACRTAFVSVIDEAVVDDGEIEGLRFLNEQSLSHDFHRYGNLGRRGANAS